MKLSTAILIGSALTKPIKHLLSDGANGRCALGAALEAVGYKVPRFPCDPNTKDYFPLVKILIRDFDGSDFSFPVGYMIVAMNDGGLYTREEIAMWVKAIEYSRGEWGGVAEDENDIKVNKSHSEVDKVFA